MTQNPISQLKSRDLLFWDVHA